MAGSRPIVVSINGDSSGLSKALKNASGKVSAFGKSVAKVGLKAGTVFAGAATAIGTKGVMAFAEFDKGMREVRTLLPEISNEAFGAMEDDLKSFQKQFGVLSDDAIGGLYSALSAGVPPNNVFEFLRTSQQLAKAGASDLETALDGITSSVNAFGSDVLSAEEASEKMFTAVKLGKTTVDEVSKSIFQMAPIASAVGINFSDLTASVAVLTSQGVPTATAATQMKQAMAELARSGSKADVAFRELSGKGMQDFLAEGGSFSDVITMMKKGADDAGVSLLDWFGSVEGGQAVLALTSDGGEKFIDVLGQMDSSAGSVKDGFDVMNTGLAASMDKIKANLEVLMIEIGQKLAPIAEKATELMIKGFDNLKPVLKRGKELAIDFADAAKERLVPIFETAREVFGIVAEKVMAVYSAVYTYLAPGITNLKDKIVELLDLGFNKLVEIFNSIEWGKVGQDIADGFEAARAKVMEFVRAIPDNFRTTLDWINRNKDMLMVLGGAVGGLVIGWKAYVVVTNTVAKAKKILLAVNKALSASLLANPIALVVIALVALAGALVVAYFRFEEVRDIVDNVARFFRDTFLPTVKVVIDMVVDYFKFMWEQIKLVVDLVTAIFKGEWGEAAKIFSKLIKNAIDFVVDFFIKLPGRLLKSLVPIISALAFIAKQFIVFLAEKVGQVIEDIVGFFIGLPGRLLDAGIDIAKSLFDMGVNFGKTIINAIVEGLRRAGGAISGFIMGLIPDVGSIVDSIVGGATSKAKGLVKSIIPGLAAGGIVTKPTLAVIGEAGPEAVVPLSAAGKLGGTTINLTVNAGVGTDGVQVGDDIVAALTSWSRQNGALPLSVSAA